MTPIALANAHFQNQRYFDAYMMVGNNLSASTSDEQQWLELGIACINALNCAAIAEQYYLRLLDLLSNRREWSAVETLYKQARQHLKNSVPIQIRAAQFYLQRQNLSEAEHCFRAALRIDAYQCFPWTELGKLLIKTNRTNEAYLAFLQAVSIDPLSADAQLQLGRSYQQRGQLNLGETHIARSLSLRSHFEGVAND